MAKTKTAMTTTKGALARDVAPFVDRIAKIIEEAQAHVVRSEEIPREARGEST